MIVIYVFRFRTSFVSWFVVFIMGVMTFIKSFSFELSFKA